MKKSIIYLLGAATAILSASCGSNTDDGLVKIAKATYNRDAIIFSLSYLSNINYGRYGTPAALEQAADTAMQNVLNDSLVKTMIGNWTTAWGPVTYTNDSTSNPDTCISDNTLVLFKGNIGGDSTKTTYVLAMSGTVTGSAYDWLGENLLLDRMAEWPAVTPGQSNTGVFASPDTSANADTTNNGNYISKGMANGLNVLLNIMKDGSKGTIMNYLKNNVGNATSSFELIVAGHSLGGALSPCVTLSLVDNQSYWNAGNTAQISCFATAGYSPGNANFKNYFNQKVPGGIGGACNAKDVAVNVYQASTIVNVHTLYNNVNGMVSPTLQKECVLNGFLSCINDSIGQFNYTSLYNLDSAFTATVDLDSAGLDSIYRNAYNAYQNNLINGTVRAAFFTMSNNYSCTTGGLFSHSPDSLYYQGYGRFTCFGAMTLQQHVNAYVNHFGITEFYGRYNNHLSKQVLPKSLDETMLDEFSANEMLLRCTGL